MVRSVDIDKRSGFCAGVIRAISQAEKVLGNEVHLFSLGDIVHNEVELERLEKEGLMTIHSLDEAHSGDTVLIRAHGEPPQTYLKAKEMNLNIVDCTCPVVLKLQKNILKTYQRQKQEGRGQIIIFGKIGHAEVLGLVGQTDSEAVVVQDTGMLLRAIEVGEINLMEPIEIFSQTTKSPVEYEDLCEVLLEKMAEARGVRGEEVISEGGLAINNTICSQVANRHENLVRFALDHDVIVFVTGKSSSNGKVLYELCSLHNFRTYHVSSPEEISDNWFRNDDRVGICGATSTPKWLLEEVANKILQKNK